MLVERDQAPEGFVISPKGDVAVAVLLGGASALKSAWFNTKRNGSVAVLKIDGKKVTKVGEVVDGTTITDTGKKLKLPGQPASMRGRAR